MPEICFSNQIDIIYQTLRIWIDFSLSFQLQHQGPYPLALTPLPHLHPLKTFLTKQQCHRDLTDAWGPLIEGPTRTQKCAIVAVTIWTQTLHCYTIITVWGDITLTMRTPIIGATRALTVNIIIKWDSVFILGRRVILNHIIWSKLLLATSSFQVSQFLSLSKFNLNLFFSKNIKKFFKWFSLALCVPRKIFESILCSECRWTTSVSTHSAKVGVSANVKVRWTSQSPASQTAVLQHCSKSLHEWRTS